MVGELTHTHAHTHTHVHTHIHTHTHNTDEKELTFARLTFQLFHFQVSLPDVYRGEYRDVETAGQLYAADVGKVVEGLKKEGTGLAAFIHEAMPCCAGQVIPPSDYYGKVYK